jgi:hypothetical protein
MIHFEMRNVWRAMVLQKMSLSVGRNPPPPAETWRHNEGDVVSRRSGAIDNAISLLITTALKDMTILSTTKCAIKHFRCHIKWKETLSEDLFGTRKCWGNYYHFKTRHVIKRQTKFNYFIGLRKPKTCKIEAHINYYRIELLLCSCCCFCCYWGWHREKLLPWREAAL